MLWILHIWTEKFRQRPSRFYNTSHLMDGVICAGRCWSFPGQSATDKKTLHNSHPVVSKKRGWRSRRLFTRKEIVVLVENLYVFKGEQIEIQCLPATAVTSYFVWLYVLHSSPNSFCVDTWTVSSWKRHVNVSKVDLPSSGMLCSRTDTNTDLTRWFKYDRDWFVYKQAALRSSCATLREWSHNLYPPFCSG